MIQGLKPVQSHAPTLMILGSMPSVTSLDKQEYYGFPHNRFWKILQETYQMPITTYEEKLDIIYQHHIVLWDVIGKCEREGSLDSAIHNVVVNDIEAILTKYPSITCIICNGKKSYSIFQKYFSHVPVLCLSLPSTSNANRSIKEVDVFSQWKESLRKHT